LNIIRALRLIMLQASRKSRWPFFDKRNNRQFLLNERRRHGELARPMKAGKAGLLPLHRAEKADKPDAAEPKRRAKLEPVLAPPDFGKD
jgi:hypothetical protein